MQERNLPQSGKIIKYYLAIYKITMQAIERNVWGRAMLIALLMIMSQASEARSDETQGSYSLIVESRKPVREYAPTVFRVKVWDEQRGLFVANCQDSTGKLFDCNQYLESLGHVVMSNQDEEKLIDSQDDLISVMIIPELSESFYDGPAFSSRFGSSEESRASSVASVELWVSLLNSTLIDRVPDIIQRTTVLPEIPGVVFKQIPKDIIHELAASPKVKKIKILDWGSKLIPMDFFPFSPLVTYPDTWGTYGYGNLYWGYPPIQKNLYTGKVAILELALPVAFSDIYQPWSSDDIFNQDDGGTECDFEVNGGCPRHATAVASVVTWENTAGYGKGLLFHTKPYWVRFNVFTDQPSSYINPLNFLQQKQVDAANVSLLAEKTPSSPPALVELAYDWQTWANGRPVFVFPSGNDDTQEVLQRSFNGVIVGSSVNNCFGSGVDSYTWKNPYSYYGDRELPDVVAQPCYTLPYLNTNWTETYSSNSWGTSFSAPVYSSLIGLLVHKFKLMGYSAPYAETLRAIIYASGEGSCDPYWKYIYPYYRFGYWTDCQFGLGDLRQANAVSIVGSSTWDLIGVLNSSYQAYYGPVFQVPAGKSFRAAIAWSQPVSCDSSGNNCDCLDGYLVHDFDLYIQESTSPNGPWTTPGPFGSQGRLSVRNDSSWEVVHASNLDPQKYYRLYAPLSLNGTFKPTFVGVAWRIY